MFNWWYLGTIVNAIDRIPREVTISVAVYCIVTDLHKRHTQVQIEEIKANVQVAKLEVEALKLKLELQKNES